MIPGHKTELERYTPDERRELYQRDPERFERLAAEAISEACISETPEESLKLRQMQGTLDEQLQKGEPGLQRLQIMEQIFYGSVFDLTHLMESLAKVIPPAGEANGESRIVTLKQ